MFRNRKGYFSINVQTICDAELRILDAVARWPGSTHDQRIFNNSRVMSRFEAGEFPNCIIVGDSGYENRPYLMTPLARVSTQAENLYNESQIRTRNVVERSYGVLKRRFPITSVGMRCKLPTVLATIHAVVVLHNIAIDEGNALPEPEMDVNEDGNIDVPQLQIGDDSARRSLIINHFSNLV